MLYHYCVRSIAGVLGLFRRRISDPGKPAYWNYQAWRVGWNHGHPITPTLDPLPKSTSTYRDGQGRLKRLTMVAVPRKEPNLDRFVAALLAMATERLEEEKHQRAATRGEVKLLSAAHKTE